MNKGNILLSKGNKPLAKRYYDKAINADPKNGRAWANRGNLMLQTGKYDDAIKSYNRAIEIDPIFFRPGYNIDYTHALSNKGTMFFIEKKYGDAIEFFDKALQVDPFNFHAWFMKARTFFELKRYKEASEYLVEHIQ